MRYRVCLTLVNHAVAGQENMTIPISSSAKMARVLLSVEGAGK